MKSSMSSRITVAAVSLTLALSSFPATSAGASEIPNSTTSTAFQVQTEKLTEQDRLAINKSFGYSALPEQASALQRNGDKINVLNDNGDEIPIGVTKLSQTGPTVQSYSATDEIKRVVGACLGIDFFGAVGAWEAIESQVTDWDKAAKFVLRRVGLVAAVSCGGGVLAEYLL